MLCGFKYCSMHVTTAECSRSGAISLLNQFRQLKMHGGSGLEGHELQSSKGCHLALPSTCGT